MSKERLNAEQIFTEALARNDPAERAAYLKQACGGDPPLIARIEVLLKAHAEADDFLSGSPLPDSGSDEQAPTKASSVAEQPGDRIGRYKLLQQVGEGGFGVVYMAEQEEPVRRKVALKIIKLGMDTKQVIARFEAERQALAMMDHPNIAKVFDAGATETGRPYFVMELVKGTPITEYCDSQNVVFPDRLKLFMRVCEAVQHAHQKGIIHRDIKPSNILVTHLDGAPVPKVIDFGIAKATEQRLTEQTMFTEFGQFLGTPAYMSPEQTDPNALDIDTRSDIYSLGVVLYELLTGTTPFDTKTLRGAALDEIKRIIREEEPSKPSTKLSTLGAELTTVAKRRGMEPRRLATILRGDLDWIILKALEKNRTRRYETANGLAADIGRYLTDEPVVAGPPSTAYRFKKFVRRNKGTVTAGAIVAAALLLGMAGTVWQARRAGIQRAEAQTQRAEALKQKVLADENAAKEVKARRRAEAINTFVIKALQSSDPMGKGTRDMTITEAMQNAVKEIDAGAFKDEPETEALLLETIANIFRNNARYSEAEPLLTRALAKREKTLGPNDPAVATSLNNLARLYKVQGKYAEAEPLYRRALAIREKVLGPDHPRLATSLNNLAELYRTQGRYALAEPLYTRALAIYEKALGPDHPYVASSLNNLALVYSTQSQYATAEPLYTRALAIWEKAFGPNHPQVAAGLTNLALLHTAQGRYAAAEPLYKRALTIHEQSLGKDHPDVAWTLNNLGDLYMMQGRFAAAEPLFKRALAIREKALGSDHPDTLESMYSCANVLYERKNLAEAETLARQLLPVQKRVWGPQHVGTLSTMILLGRSLRDQALRGRGDYAEAEQLLRQAVEIQTQIHGPEHLRTLHAVAHLAALCKYQGNVTEAEEILGPLIERLTRVKGAEHRHTIGRVLDLAELYTRQRRYEEAEPLLKSNVEIARRALGNEDPLTLRLIEALGRMYQWQGKYEQAEPLLVEYLEFAGRTGAADLPEALWVYYDLGILYHQQGKYGNAEPLLAKAMEIAGSAWGEKHSSTNRITTSLAKLYEAWHEVEPDQGYDAKADEWRAKIEPPAIQPAPRAP